MELNQLVTAEEDLKRGEVMEILTGRTDWIGRAANGVLASIECLKPINPENPNSIQATVLMSNQLADIIQLAYQNQFTVIDTPVELIDMAKRMKDLSDRYDILDANLKLMNAEYDALRLKAIPDKMAELDIKTVTYEGIGRVQLAADCHASIPAEVKPDAFSWLRNNEFGDMIVETVNPSTLKAFAKEQMKKGVELPEELFKVTPFSRASIVKK